MACTAHWVHHGPSLYSRAPVIRYTLGSTAAGSLGPDPEFALERLFALLPGLREDRSPCEVTPSTPIAHLFEHIGIELQNLAGTTLGCVRPQGARIDVHDAVLPFEEERVGLEAGSLAVELIDSLRSTDSPPDFERRLQAFSRFAERQRLPLQDLAFVRAAEARDIPVLRIAGRLLQLGHGRHQQRVSGTETTRTNILSNDLAANKDYARRLFRAVGLPVPTYERVYRARDAVAAARRIGFPVVLKPNDSNMGIGVSVGLRTADEVRDAFRRAREVARSVIVEEFVSGADYRLLVIDGRLEAATKRIPAHVIGDGVSTIEELVRLTNLDPRRGGGHRGQWTRIELDDQSERRLTERGYDRGSVPRDGEAVYLRYIANASAGGTGVDVTDQVHPENRDIAERAARTIGLDVAGVDLLVPDITQPLRAQGGVICEINSRPGIRKHLWPAEGQPRDVVGAILDMLFPPGSRSRIPIAVVTGLGDRARVARLLVDLLAADGRSVGLATPDGVFIDGRRADGGGLDGPSATRLLLLDPAVELAVVDLSPSEVSRHGLGYDWADACAIVNDRSVESPDLVEALRLVVSSSRSHVVLSSDDERAYRLKPQPEARVWYVNPHGHGSAQESGDTSACEWSGLTSDPSTSELYATALALSLGRTPGEVEQRLASLTVDRVSS
jgi:cyanophycin synthetase